MPYTPPITGPRPYDMLKNQFSNAGGSVVTQKVWSTFDLIPPIEQVIRYRHRGYTPFIALFRAMGYSAGVSTPTTGHFERGWDENTIKVGTIVTLGAAAGSPAVFGLDPVNMVDVGAKVNGVARQASVVRDNDQIMLKSGTLCYAKVDRTFTPHRVTLTPMTGTVILDASKIAIGDTMVIGSNAYSEGSGLGEGLTPQYFKYGNTFQIIKEKAAVTGSQMTNVNRVNDPMVSGSNQSMDMIVNFETEQRFERKKSLALLLGEQNTNAALFDYNTERGIDAPISGTEGFLPYAKMNGTTSTYTPGTYSLNNFDATNRIYTNERIGTRELFTLDGYAILQETENVLLNFFNTTRDAYLDRTFSSAIASYGGGDAYLDSDFAVKIGFKSVTKGGFTYRFSQCDEFNDIQLLGATGFDYNKWRLIMPMGTKTDQKSMKQTPMFGYEYKSLNGYSRDSVVGRLNGAGVEGVAVNQYDIASTWMVSEIAAHMACGNGIVRQIPA